MLNVSFEGDDQPLGVTDNHLFWSPQRERFIPIGEMEIGDQVITYAGETKRIESKLPRPGPQTVYNLEVYGEHVYFVGHAEVLAHNAYELDEAGQVATLTINHRLKKGKTTDLLALAEEVRLHEEAANAIIGQRGIAGFQQRLQQFEDYGDEIIAAGRRYTA